jgi:hypothetical protein
MTDVTKTERKRGKEENITVSELDISVHCAN